MGLHPLVSGLWSVVTPRTTPTTPGPCNQNHRTIPLSPHNPTTLPRLNLDYQVLER